MHSISLLSSSQVVRRDKVTSPRALTIASSLPLVSAVTCSTNSGPPARAHELVSSEARPSMLAVIEAPSAITSGASQDAAHVASQSESKQSTLPSPSLSPASRQLSVPRHSAVSNAQSLRQRSTPVSNPTEAHEAVKSTPGSHSSLLPTMASPQVSGRGGSTGPAAPAPASPVPT